MLSKASLMKTSHLNQKLTISFAFFIKYSDLKVTQPIADRILFLLRN
jgi:hypothetical protein